MVRICYVFGALGSRLNDARFSYAPAHLSSSVARERKTFFSSSRCGDRSAEYSFSHFFSRARPQGGDSEPFVGRIPYVYVFVDSCSS